MSTQPSEHVGTRLMFENDRVRVWDLSLEPGESCDAHVHKLDYFYVVESGGLLRFDDPDRPEGHQDIQFEDDQVRFREVGADGKIDQRSTNVGTKRHRNYVIELKRP